jgi:transposase
MDVGLEETSVCVVDKDGNSVRETKVATEPAAIRSALEGFADRLGRAGIEASSLGLWLYRELHPMGLPVIIVEARHMRVSLSTMLNKTDKTDALGLAHLMRTGGFRQAHIKSEACYRLRLLLIHRRNLKRKFVDLENAIQHSLKAFGMRFKGCGRGGFAQAVRDAVAGDPPW